MAEPSPPPTPREKGDAEDWTWVDRVASGDEAEEAGRPFMLVCAKEPAGADDDTPRCPSPSAGAGGAPGCSQTAGRFAADKAMEPPSGGDTDDTAEDLASAESERLADSVLCQPFSGTVTEGPQPAGQLWVATEGRPGAAAAMAAGADEHHDAHDIAAFWRFDRSRMRAVTRLSSEGALEGFQDPPAGEAQKREGGQHAADEHDCGEADDPDDGALLRLSLTWEGGMWGAVREELTTEWGNLCTVASSAAHAAWSGVCVGGKVVHDWLVSCQQAAAKVQRRFAKAMGAPCPAWAVVSMSSLAAMAFAALASQVAHNHQLVVDLRQRDKELARLVVKVLHLQDALHSASRSLPLLRHTSAEALGAHHHHHITIRML